VNKHLLVIGAGYVGGEVVRQARMAGWQVTAVNRSGKDGAVAANVADRESLAQLAAVCNPSHVLHCAAASVQGSDVAERLARYRSVYRAGCENCVAAFPSARFLFTSSSSVYAQTSGELVTEESVAEPASETAQVLIESEAVVLHAGGMVARLSGIYGVGRCYMLKRLFSGEPAIEGDGSRVLNHIHQVDAANACLFLLENGVDGEIYNVTDSAPISQRLTYEKLSAFYELPVPAILTTTPPARRGWSSKAVSNSKLIALGWQPAYPSFVEAAKCIFPREGTEETHVK